MKMSEVQETETVEVNPTEELVNNIMSDNLAAATPQFNELLRDRLNQAMDQEKIAMANVVFNGKEPEESSEPTDEEEQLELDLSDEEVMEDEEDATDEVISDEEIDDFVDNLEDDAEK